MMGLETYYHDNRQKEQEGTYKDGEKMSKNSWILIKYMFLNKKKRTNP